MLALTSPFSGPSHEVGRDQLFFSTTDAEGIITQANSVFVEMVRLPRDKLIGAPHRVNRHPGMPGGAFLLMWTMLKAGRPFCAYVHNSASDGSRYTVFATITPLGTGYLSVRSRVFATGLLDAATSLYEAVRPAELRAQVEGTSAHDAAVLGLERLVPLLQAAGFPTYDEFIWAALPAEVAGRDAAGATYPERPDASGSMAAILGCGAGIHVELQRWFVRLGDLQETADALVAARARLSDTIDAWAAKAAEFEASGDGTFRPILLSINVWRDMAGEIGRLLEGLMPDLDALRAGCAEARFRIALARLHNDAVGQFACEVIDGLPGSDAARPAIRDLARALSEGVAETVAQMARTVESASRVSAEVREMAELVAFPIPLLEGWQAMAEASSDPVAVSLLPGVASVVERGNADAALLSGLAEQAARVAQPLDAQAVNAALTSLVALVEGDAAGSVAQS